MSSLVYNFISKVDAYCSFHERASKASKKGSSGYVALSLTLCDLVHINSPIHASLSHLYNKDVNPQSTCDG